MGHTGNIVYGAITTTPYIALKYTDTNNMVRLYRQAATNYRVERVVAGVVTTELDITVDNAVTSKFNSSSSGSMALHILPNNTTCRVFLQGDKIAEFELSAAAQALTGDSVAWGTPNIANLQMLNALEVYAL
jgi:hypothetical protein